MDLLHWVRDLLTPADAPTAPAAGVPDTDRPAAAPTPADIEAVRRTVDAEIGRLLRARPMAMAGRVVRLSLEPLADRLGDRWPSSAGRVRTAAAAILGRRLGDSAIILPYGPLEFLAVAPHRAPHSALAATAGAAAEITRFAFGGDDAGPRPALAVVDGLANEQPHFTPVDVELILTGQAGAAVLTPPSLVVAGPPPAAAAGAIGSEPAAPATIRHAPLGPAPTGQAARAMLGPLWRPMAGNTATSAPAAGAMGEADDLSDTLPGQLSCDYRPVISLARGRVAAGLLRPQLRRGRSALRGYAVLGPSADAVDIGQLDLYCLHQAITDLDLAVAQERAVFITLAVHFETLAPTARRMIYAGRLASVADRTGARLAPEIVGCPPDVATSFLEAMLAPIRPHCRMVLMRIALDQRRVDAISATGMRRVGIHLGRHADRMAQMTAAMVAGSMSPTISATPANLSALGQAIQRAGMRLHVYGIDDDARLDLAAGAGADLVAGEAIGAATAKPPLIGLSPKASSQPSPSSTSPATSDQD